MKPGTKRVAAFCFLKHKNQFLLLKRTKMPYFGVFAPVGGSVEPHETPEQAAIREAYEEADIKVSEVSFCGILAETSPIDYNWISFIYTVEIPYQVPGNCDEGQLMWIDQDIAPTLHIPPTDPAIYRYMRQGESFVLNAIYNADMQLISMKNNLTGEIIV